MLFLFRLILGTGLLVSTFLLGTGNAYARNLDIERSAGASGGFSYGHFSHELRFSGRIGNDFDERLATAMAAYPHAEALVITSNGGYLESALRGATLLNRADMPVRASGVCASACAMLWLDSDHRELSADAHLGLHASHAAQTGLPAGLEALRAGNAQAEQGQILQRAGVSATVIAQALDTPPDQVLWLGASALRRAGVFYQLMD